MTTYESYWVVCLTPMPIMLDKSEIETHAKVVEALTAMPSPWTPIGPFKPLRKAGAGGVTTLEVLGKRIFPRWISEVMVDYIPRTPGALGRGTESKDRLHLVVDPNKVPENQWVGNLLPGIIRIVKPGIIGVMNSGAKMHQSREMQACRKSNRPWKIVAERLSHEYGQDRIPEVFFASRQSCQDCFGMSAEELAAGLTAQSIAVSLLPEGLLVTGCDRYVSTDEALAIQERLTQGFLRVLAERGRAKP
jgi:hypothetical protein